MARRRAGLTLALLCWAVHGRAADYPAIGLEVARHVADSFYDPARADAWVKAHVGYADAARDRLAFARLTNLALDDLRASHTRLYTPDEVAFYGLKAIFAPSLKVAVPTYEGIGVDLADGRFVRHGLASGPAEAAGLKRGDEIVAADGRPFEPIGSFLGKAGRPVALTVRRLDGGPTAEVRVTPRSITPTQEWREATARGAKIVREGDKSVAYVPLFSAAGDWPKELVEELLAGPLRSADALVLDFRDGWGGANPDFVNLFNQAPPALTFVERDGNRREYDPQWRKPLVLLINGGTRSGKETVAHAIKARKLGTLVGERTAGAVIAGRPFVLSDGSILFLAVADVLVDGRHLEGIGVTPDVEVASTLPHADGSDPQLTAALAAAARLAAGR